MNKLAEEQKKIYEKGLIENELLRRQEEFSKLYYELRNLEDKKIFNKLSLEQRKKIHKIILEIYKLKNRLGGFSFRCNYC